MRSGAGIGGIGNGVYITGAGSSNSTCKGPGVQSWAVCTMFGYSPWVVGTMSWVKAMTL